MMEARKRPASPENIGPSPKKRMISASDWSKPISVRGLQSNGEEEDDEDEIAADQLERFRKEAIFRRMKHYARLYEDAAQRMRDMEAKVNARDTAVAAVDAVWNQLVTQVQSLIPNGLPPMNESSLEIYNITYALPLDNEPEPRISAQYYERLRETSIATQKLIASLVHLAPTAPSPESYELRTQCAAYRSEAAIFRAEGRILRSKLHDALNEVQEYREKLAASENRVERVRSETVVIMEAKIGKPLSLDLDAEKKDVHMANGDLPITNGTSHAPITLSEEEDWKRLAENREAKLREISKEVGDLKDEVTRLKLELQDPTEATVTETVHYKKLLRHLSDLKSAADEAKERATKLSEEVLELKASRMDFQKIVQPELETKLEQMKTSMQKLQTDNNRLRGTRDSITTEFNALKTRDQKQSLYVNGLKSTNAVQKDRIATLVQETRRLRAALAVETADEDYYAFIADNLDERASFVSSLKAQLKEAETKASALEKTLEGVNTAHPDVARHVQSEVEARQLYALSQERLAKYERVYGSGSSSGIELPAEPQKLVELLAEKEEALRAIKSLKRQEDERTHGAPTAMDDLCRQIEELIALKEKEVSDQAALEEKVSKAQAEKAKAESKYFAAMRLKDAAEGERKTIEAALGKQVKRIEKLQESEQSLKQQIQMLEKLSASARQEFYAVQQNMVRLEDDMQLAYMTNESQSKRVAEIDRERKERQDLAESRRQQIRKLEEDNMKLKRDLGRAEHRADHVAPTSGSPTEVSKQNDNLLKILKCSTCTKELRSHVLIKCMHTFCKSCIDARVSTRQRKCPACQMSFAQSDVQTIYFQ